MKHKLVVLAVVFGFLDRTPRGRVTATRAFEHFGRQGLIRNRTNPTLFSG